jgi:myosin heavy subunit
MLTEQTDSHCWAVDEAQVYKVVKIRDKEGDLFKVSDVDATTGLPLSQVFTVPKSQTFQIFALEELHSPPSDLIQLTDVHRAGILHALRHRFERDLIYTSVGPILVALNPFKWIPGIYDEDIKNKYSEGTFSLSENPHVFAMAHDSHLGLQLGRNQSLIISGESGAGKTEATKQCLSYLATAAGSSTGLQTKILQASPILEAWGNAKTLRNNNSSRFGKFIEIWFGSNFEIIGASNTTYLLEKSRVVFQESGERNYHVFYQLLMGAPQEIISDLQLTDLAADPNSVSYINQSGCIQIEGINH